MARTKKRDRNIEAPDPVMVDHVVVEEWVLEPVVQPQLVPNYGAEMLEGICALSGLLQRGFEDMGDNFNVMRHDLSVSFAELSREGRQELEGIWDRVTVGNLDQTMK